MYTKDGIVFLGIMFLSRQMYTKFREMANFLIEKSKKHKIHTMHES